MILGGLRIISVPNWRKVPDGTFTALFPNHPLVRWLDRKFPALGIGQFTEETFPKYRDVDPIYDRERAVVYCSPSQYVELAAAWRREASAMARSPLAESWASPYMT